MSAIALIAAFRYSRSSLPSTHLRLQQAADQIAKDTDGKVELRLFPNNQLGGEVDLLNQVRSGAVEMFVVGGLIASSVVPAAAFLHRRSALVSMRPVPSARLRGPRGRTYVALSSGTHRGLGRHSDRAMVLDCIAEIGRQDGNAR